jgi:hypothetical protein
VALRAIYPAFVDTPPTAKDALLRSALSAAMLETKDDAYDAPKPARDAPLLPLADAILLRR